MPVAYRLLLAVVLLVPIGGMVGSVVQHPLRHEWSIPGAPEEQRHPR